MATLKNIQQEVIKFTRKHIGFYDAIFLGGFAVSFILPTPVDSLAIGFAIYGAINAVVKNARPDLTIITTNKGTEIVE